MPTQAQRQRDWEFVAELKPEDGRAKTGAPGLEASAADRIVLASLPPSASFGSGDSRQSPAGGAGAEAAVEPPGNGASWGWGGAAGSDTRPSGGGGLQLTAYQTGVGATGQGKAQPVLTAAESNAEGAQPVSRGSGAMPGKTPGGAAGATNRAATGGQQSGSGSGTPKQIKPTEYFGESYGPPDPRKPGRQQQIIRTLQGKQATPGNSPYAVAGKVLEAERKLPPEQRRVIERARNGQPLTQAERRLWDRAQEQGAYDIGQPFTALEMKYRRLFGPGSINPRSLEVEDYLPPLEAIHRFGSPFLTPRAHAARQHSYDVYVRKVLKGEATAPPSFSDNPQYQALQKADLQRIQEWVRTNLRIDHRVAMLDLSDPKVKKELARELAHPSRTGVTDFAKQKKLYLDHLRLLGSPQAVTLLGIQTHFGKQLLKAIVDEQLTRLPEARKEWLAHEEDGLQMALLPLAGASVEANVTQRLAASPNATRVLGPAARGVPAATAGALEGGVQQVQAAYDSGERRPLELAKAFGVGATVGGIGGFFFGSLPAKQLTQVERAQAAAALEQETVRLQGIIRSNPGLSRETHHAVQELAQVQSRMAELRDLSQPVKRGEVSPQAPRPAPNPPVKVKLPEGTQRGGVNRPLQLRPDVMDVSHERATMQVKVPEALPPITTKTAPAPQKKVMPTFSPDKQWSGTVTATIPGDRAVGFQAADRPSGAMDRRPNTTPSLPGNPEGSVAPTARQVKPGKTPSVASARDIPEDYLAQFRAAAETNTSSEYPGPNRIKKRQDLDTDSRRVEAEFAAWIEADPQRAMRLYRERFGNDVSTDKARELWEEYAASSESRTKYASAVYEPARKLARMYFDERIRQPTQPGELDIALFMAGGPGSGKSSVTQADPAADVLSKKAHILVDSSLSNFDEAARMIKMAISTGRKPVIYYVHSPVEKATANAISRIFTEGRPVTLDQIAKLHYNAQKTIFALRDEFADKLKIVAVNNSGARGEAKKFKSLDELAELPGQMYESEAEVRRRAEEVFWDEYNKRQGTEQAITDEIVQAMGARRPDVRGVGGGASTQGHREPQSQRAPRSGAKVTPPDEGASGSAPGTVPVGALLLEGRRNDTKSVGEEGEDRSDSPKRPGGAGTSTPSLPRGARVEYRTREGKRKSGRIEHRNLDGTYRLSNGISAAPAGRLRLIDPPSTPERVADVRIQPGMAESNSLAVGTVVEYYRSAGPARRSTIVARNADGTYQLRNGIARADPKRLRVLTRSEANGSSR